TPTNNCGYLPYQGVPIASSVVYGINGKEADACWKEWSEKYAKEKGLTVEVLPIDKYLSLGFNMMINEGNYGSVILVRSSEQNKRLYLNAINGREINTESYEELAANLKISKTIAGPGKNIYIITRPDLEDEVPPYKE
ncbi:MAG: hypothetical protein O2897_00970, partial [bacterium]|nr:hypothetical protein [bacterium]